MAKRKTSSQSEQADKPPQLPPLTGIGRDVLAYVLNNVAFQHYDECCSIDAMAEHFGRTPGHFKTTVQKLVDQGYRTIQGETYPWVYPTVAALRGQDEKLSASDAEKLLAKLMKPKRKSRITKSE